MAQGQWVTVMTMVVAVTAGMIIDVILYTTTGVATPAVAVTAVITIVGRAMTTMTTLIVVMTAMIIITSHVMAKTG